MLRGQAACAAGSARTIHAGLLPEAAAAAVTGSNLTGDSHGGAPASRMAADRLSTAHTHTARVSPVSPTRCVFVCCSLDCRSGSHPDPLASRWLHAKHYCTALCCASQWLTRPAPAEEAT
jgi:hypothetical protein